MTLAEMKALGSKAERIENLQRLLAERERELTLLNSRAPKLKNSTWSFDILLEKGGGWGGRDVTFAAKLPFAVVQQQAVYAVEAARRELIKAGGLG